MKLPHLRWIRSVRNVCIVVATATLASVVIAGCSARYDHGPATESHVQTPAGSFARPQNDRLAQVPPLSGTEPTPLDDILRYPAAWPATRPSEGGPIAMFGTPGASRLDRPKAQNDLSRLVPPQSLPDRREELWVIEKPSADAAPHVDPHDEPPGSGALMAKRPPADKSQPAELVPVPLKYTDVKASVSGYITAVDVTQQFQNPFNEKIEAVYVFPLPHNAAVSEFIMTVGDRRIRGIIRERREAEQIYQAARNQGYVASLLTQERPNVFTQSVANIEPGKQIDINVRYFNTLAYVDGWYEFVFPMVVGPRFNPPGTTSGIGAVGQGARGASGQKTEVTYLRPEQRSGHDISVAVDLNAGMAIDQIDSRNHKVDVKQFEKGDKARAQVTLDPADSIPNKDFFLRYKLAGADVKSSILAHKDPKDERGGYFTLMLVPPEDLKHLPRQPLEMVFTIDISGSQRGAPLAQAKAATRYALTHMGADDTFQVVRFGDTARTLFPAAAAATPDNVRLALKWVDGFEANEGTVLVDGVRASLIFPHDERRTRYVAFMTDGFIGNETEALAEIHKYLGPARIFSFGVGSSTNRYLLDHMAKMGNGAVAYLGLNDDANEVMGQYFERISHPALTDITIDWGGMQVSEVFPRKVPDLFVGRPVILTGRFRGDGVAKVRVKGKAGGEPREFDVELNPDQPTADVKALPAVWARTKIADLADQATYEGGKELPDEIKQVALEYGLMSAYTAFVAVDSMTRTSGDHGTSVGVAVPVPDGVRYDTTVQEGQPAP